MNYTVSIGIPTLNGAAHIGLLIADLLNQNLKGLTLSSITIHADECTDGTQKLIRKISAKKSFIKIIDTKRRVGKSQGINNLFQSFDSDIAIILDDDVRVTDREFLRKITAPIIKDKIDLVSCPMYPIKNGGIVSKSLRAGTLMKEKTIQNLRNGQNIYACRGPVRAHSKNLYRHITLSSQAIADDMYTYLFAKTNNYTFHYVTNTCILFKVPENIVDHRKQGIRFFQSINKLENQFGAKLVKKEFQVPILFKMQQIVKSFMTDHVWLLFYLLLYLFNRVSNFFTPTAKDDHWDRISAEKVKTINPYA